MTWRRMNWKSERRFGSGDIIKRTEKKKRRIRNADKAEEKPTPKREWE
jgi:hypothetical protein